MNALFFIWVFWLFYPMVLILRLLLKPFARLGLHLRSKRPKILFLATFFPNNAGYHYRVKLWADALQNEGFHTRICSVYSEKQFHSLRNRPLPHVGFYLIGMIKRLGHILVSLGYDRVIVRREILLFNDYGNLFYEKLLLSVHPNAILDFDDDIAEAKGEPKKIGFFGKLLLEHPHKFSHSVSMYHYFIVGSKYLKDYAMKLNPWLQPHQLLIVPTSVDYDKYPSKKYEASNTLNLGWIGSNNNQKYLNLIEEDLEKLADRYDITLHIISGKPYETKRSINVINHNWSIENEISSLMQLDVGIMPLTDSKLQKGKCGFKLIQYMGLGIFGIASKVGANEEIIDHGKNGFLIDPGESWLDTLEALATNKNNFSSLGAEAKNTVNARYSISGNLNSFVTFIKTLHANEQ